MCFIKKDFWFPVAFFNCIEQINSYVLMSLRMLQTSQNGTAMQIPHIYSIENL